MDVLVTDFRFVMHKRNTMGSFVGSSLGAYATPDRTLQQNRFKAKSANEADFVCLGGCFDWSVSGDLVEQYL